MGGGQSKPNITGPLSGPQLFAAVEAERQREMNKPSAKIGRIGKRISVGFIKILLFLLPFIISVVIAAIQIVRYNNVKESSDTPLKEGHLFQSSILHGGISVLQLIITIYLMFILFRNNYRENKINRSMQTATGIAEKTSLELQRTLGHSTIIAPVIFLVMITFIQIGVLIHESGFVKRLMDADIWEQFSNPSTDLINTDLDEIKETPLIIKNNDPPIDRQLKSQDRFTDRQSEFMTHIYDRSSAYNYYDQGPIKYGSGNISVNQ